MYLKKIIQKKKNILITAPVFFFQEHLSLLEKKFNCLFVEKPDKKKIIKQLKNIHAWLCHPSPEYFFDKKILTKANSLELIATPSTGTTHIDLEYCKSRKIKVLPITISKKFEKIKASSEFTFLLCLLGFKNLVNALNQVRIGNWRNIENKIRGNEIIGKEVGIFGYGRIGKNLNKYFSAMGAKVSFFDIKKSIRSSRKRTKDQILQNSDLIIICVSYRKHNFNFVDKKFFSKSPNETIFIPKGAVHRIQNSGLKTVKIMEAQLGYVLKESDIVRFEDIYGRAN